MNMLEEGVFLQEIVLQSKIAQRAAVRLKDANESFDHIEIWSSIQSILVAAGNVSKILWPNPNKKNAARGEKLRRLIKIEEDNLLSDRKFRNHFEHYDERIEEWFNTRPTVVYSDLAMNPQSIFGNVPTNSHRAYNTVDNTLIFRGELLDLNEVLKALQEILDKCKPYVLIRN